MVKRGSETEEIQAIGLQTFKQYLSAAMHLQLCQEFMLYGDQINPALTQGLCTRWALKHHKQNENLRKQDKHVDAAASKTSYQLYSESAPELQHAHPQTPHR